MARAVFLDRDGVINRKLPEGQYVTRWDQVKFFPQCAQAVKRMRDAGFLTVVVTNQRVVAKGLLSEPALELLHQRICWELFKGEKGFDAIYYCPHEENPPCECRKPRPGMLLKAAQDHGIDLANSWMIGDSEADVLAGKTVGCRTIRICPPELECSSSADAVVGSLVKGIGVILGTEQALDTPTSTDYPNPF